MPTGVHSRSFCALLKNFSLALGLPFQFSCLELGLLCHSLLCTCQTSKWGCARFFLEMLFC